MVLPLRDEGAISLGLGSLPGLFVGSLLLTLVAAPLSTLIFSLPNLSKGKVLDFVILYTFNHPSVLTFTYHFLLLGTLAFPRRFGLFLDNLRSFLLDKVNKMLLSSSDYIIVMVILIVIRK